MTPYDQSSDDSKDERQPYEPPKVVSEEVFETLALSCGPNEVACALIPQS